MVMSNTIDYLNKAAIQISNTLVYDMPRLKEKKALQESLALIEKIKDKINRA